jgi:N-acetylmuramoyl-L-alanine amidase
MTTPNGYANLPTRYAVRRVWEAQMIIRGHTDTHPSMQAKATYALASLAAHSNRIVSRAALAALASIKQGTAT